MLASHALHSDQDDNWIAIWYCSLYGVSPCMLVASNCKLYALLYLKYLIVIWVKPTNCNWCISGAQSTSTAHSIVHHQLSFPCFFSSKTCVQFRVILVSNISHKDKLLLQIIHQLLKISARADRSPRPPSVHGRMGLLFPQPTFWGI